MMTRFPSVLVLALVLALAACDTITTTGVEAELSRLSVEFDAGYLGDATAADPSETSVALEHAFPSTNAANVDQGWAHVELAEARVGEVDLTFVSERGFVSCFEYRADDAATSDPRDNFNAHISDGLWPFVCVNDSTSVLSIEADTHVDVRLSFGAERDERFDWTRFYVMTEETKDVCKDGGWQDRGFRNQGQCIASFQANENSRHHR